MTSAAGGGSAAESGGPGGAGATAPMVQKAGGTEDTVAHGRYERMAELIPRRVLFGNPERISPRISPDASTLAWIAPHEGVRNVWTAPVGPDGVDWATARAVTGELVKEVENPGFVDWVADAELVVRCGIAPQPDGGMVVMIRDDAGQDWRPLLSIAAEDALTSQPIAFSADGGSLLGLSSVGANTGRLVRIDLASGATQVLAEDPEADVTGVRLHPDTREPQVVIFLKDRSQYLALDPAL